MGHKGRVRGEIGEEWDALHSRRGEKVSGAFLVSGSYRWGNFVFLDRYVCDCVRLCAMLGVISVDYSV